VLCGSVNITALRNITPMTVLMTASENFILLIVAKFLEG
jgi:hypothetical protein